MTTTEEQVQVLLDLAGIEPSPDEFAQLVAGFPPLRAGVERLWALELADAAPSMVFRAGEAYGAEAVAS